jgi:hypothetical protein
MQVIEIDSWRSSLLCQQREPENTHAFEDWFPLDNPPSLYTVTLF